MKLLILALAGGVLAGCTTVEGDGALLSDEPSFQAGYGDGCATGVEEDKSFSRKKTRDAISVSTMTAPIAPAGGKGFCPAHNATWKMKPTAVSFWDRITNTKFTFP